jgi:hypothetical protein
MGEEQDLHDPDEVQAKYRACAGRRLPPEQVDQLGARVSRLEDVGDVRELMTLATGLLGVGVR